jgi:hypothetical protein
MFFDLAGNLNGNSRKDNPWISIKKKKGVDLLNDAFKYVNICWIVSRPWIFFI